MCPLAQGVIEFMGPFMLTVMCSVMGIIIRILRRAQNKVHLDRILLKKVTIS
jgi:hypothetical protein